MEVGIVPQSEVALGRPLCVAPSGKLGNEVHPLTRYRIRLGPPNLVLLFILAVAIALRAYCVGANLPDYPAWDEPNIVGRAFAVGGGDLNPHFFRWPGSLLIYANTGVFAAYYVVGYAAGWFGSLLQFQRAYQADPTAFYVLARLLNIGAALVTVWLVFLAAGRLGLFASAIAGLMIAVSPLHVQESAVAYTDVPATLFLIAAVLAIGCFSEKPRTAAYVLAGLLIGLGTAIKYYVVVGAVGIVCAAMLSPLPWLLRIQLLVIAGTSAIGGFVIGCPFSVLAFKEFSADLLYQIAHQFRGHLGFEPVGNPAVWYVRNSLLPAVGLPALLAGCWGVIPIVRHHRAFLPLIATGIAYFLFTILSNVSFPRYAVPHVPIVSLAAAVGIWQLRTLPILAWLAAASIVAAPASHAVGVAIERAKEDTRAVAARWLQARIPPSTHVLTSYDGPRIPATLKLSQFRPISEKEFAVVESGGIDVFVLTSGTTRRMQDETVLENHPEIAKSHLKLYEWVRIHGTLAAVFRPGPHHRGQVVEIYMTSSPAVRERHDAHVGGTRGRQPPRYLATNRLRALTGRGYLRNSSVRV